MSFNRKVILAEIIDILLHWHRLGQLIPNFLCLKPDDKNRKYPVIVQGHSKKLASTEKNKNMLKLIKHAISVTMTLLIFHFWSQKLHEKQLYVHYLQETIFSYHPGGFPGIYFCLCAWIHFVYYHSALLAHFPAWDEK